MNNELGITFYDYINSFRLEKAKEILDVSGFEGCIEDVAISSGFNSVSTFRRSFQKKIRLYSFAISEKCLRT